MNNMNTEKSVSTLNEIIQLRIEIRMISKKPQGDTILNVCDYCQSKLIEIFLVCKTHLETKHSGSKENL